MKTSLISSLRLPGVSTFALLVALVSGTTLTTQHSFAQTVAVPNGDFSFAQGSIGGIIGSPFNAQLGAGPWYANSSGILGILAMPTVTIGSGVGSIGGLANGLGGFTTAQIYNSNIGTNFVTGQTYNFTVDFSSSTTLNLGLLSNAGFGAALYSGGSGTSLGTQVARTPGTLTTLNVNLLTANTGRVSLSYLATAPVNGQSIGISLFVGDGAGLNLGALGNITFDNVTVTAVPEPAAFGILGGGLALLAAIGLRRRQPSVSADQQG